jgi:hypothetical protein
MLWTDLNFLSFQEEMSKLQEKISSEAPCDCIIKKFLALFTLSVTRPWA